MWLNDHKLFCFIVSFFTWSGRHKTLHLRSFFKESVGLAFSLQAIKATDVLKISLKKNYLTNLID